MRQHSFRHGSVLRGRTLRGVEAHTADRARARIPRSSRERNLERRPAVALRAARPALCRYAAADNGDVALSLAPAEAAVRDHVRLEFVERREGRLLGPGEPSVGRGGVAGSAGGRANGADADRAGSGVARATACASGRRSGLIDQVGKGSETHGSCRHRRRSSGSRC